MQEIKLPENDYITIDTREYKALVEAQVRLNIFSEYVKRENYISKGECAMLLGIKIEPEPENS